MEKFDFICPICNTKLKVSWEFNGEICNCPSCDAEIVPVCDEEIIQQWEQQKQEQERIKQEKIAAEERIKKEKEAQIVGVGKMAKVNYDCPSCKGKISIPFEYLGLSCICPHCSVEIHVDKRSFICIDSLKQGKDFYYLRCPFCNENLLVNEKSEILQNIKCTSCNQIIHLLNRDEYLKLFPLKKNQFSHSSASISNRRRCLWCNGTGTKETPDGRKNTCYRCHGIGFVSTQKNKYHPSPVPSKSANSPSVQIPDSSIITCIFIILIIAVFVGIIESCEGDPRSDYEKRRDELRENLIRSVEKSPDYQYLKWREKQRY